jgi:hypothetical protein
MILRLKKGSLLQRECPSSPLEHPDQFNGQIQNLNSMVMPGLGARDRIEFDEESERLVRRTFVNVQELF